MVDQLFLLVAAIMFIVAMMMLIAFFDKKGLSERLSFFIVTNTITYYILTWLLLKWFPHTRIFWMFCAGWSVLHVLGSAVWAISGRMLELCVVTIFVEAYTVSRLAKWPSFRQMIGGKPMPDGTFPS